MNKMAVEQWNIARDQHPFEIVLVQSSYFTQLKSNIKQTSVDSYHKKYEQTLVELKKCQKEGKLKEEEYRKKLKELEDRYDNQLKNLDSYVDQFARIDLSELSKNERRFIELVHAGRLDEAAKAYSTLNAAGKYITAVENVNRLNEGIVKLKDEKAHQQETANAFFAMLKRQVNTLKLAGGEDNYKKAGELLKRAALADTTNVDVVGEYARFSFVQNEFKESERFWLIALRNSNNDIYKQAYIENELGVVYQQLEEFTKGEFYLFKALEKSVVLVKQNSDSTRAILAKSQKRLGDFYNTTRVFPKAEKFMLKALNNYTLLFNENPDAYRLLLAGIQSSLGGLYYDQQNYTKTEEYMLKALENYTWLFNQDPEAYRINLGSIQISLGVLYFSLNKSAETEDYYLKALENNILLFSKNPDAYRAILAMTQSNLGLLYNTLNDYTKAEEYMLKALDNTSQLFNMNPESHQSMLAKIQMNLANLYYSEDEMEKAEKMVLLSLDNYTQLFTKKPDVYLFELTKAQYALGVIYKETHDYPKAKDFLDRANQNCRTLFRKDSKAYSDISISVWKELVEVSRAMNIDIEEDPLILETLASITDLTNSFSELYSLITNEEIASEETYIHALENYTKLFNQNPEAFRADMAKAQVNLAKFYFKNKKYAEAEKYYSDALDNLSFLFSQNPEAHREDFAINLRKLGDVYKKTKDYTKAEECYLKSKDQYEILSSREPEDYLSELARMQNELGNFYENLNNYAKAEEYYMQALQNYKILFEKQPDDCRERLAWVQYSLMYIYVQDNDKPDQYDEMLDAALANYEVLYQSDKDYQSTIVELRNRKGWRLLRNNKTDEAIKLFENAYKLSPEESKPYLAAGYNSKAYEHANASNYDRALETIDKAIALMPDNANYYDSKGEILLMKGDEQGAVKMWQKVLELDPDFLSKHDGETPLYKQLKAKGLITE